VIFAPSTASACSSLKVALLLPISFFLAAFDDHARNRGALWRSPRCRRP
jgi:hypothetical protein